MTATYHLGHTRAGTVAHLIERNDRMTALCGRVVAVRTRSQIDPATTDRILCADCLKRWHS